MLAVLIAAAGAEERPDFRVNDDGGTAEQNNPRLAVAADGSFMVTWADKRLGNSDIFLQRFDAVGEAVGRNARINDDAGIIHQASVAMAADLSGRFSLVWNDFRNGSYPFNPDIFFQRLDTNATLLGANQDLTNEWPDSLKEAPDIALSSWGDGVVVWADFRNQNWDIYGQLFDADGSLVGGNFRVDGDQAGKQQHAPRVAFAPEGWFVVVWYDNRFGHDDIFAQRFSETGEKLGSEVRVNSETGQTRQAFPDVAADGRGHFTVVWVDWRNGVYPANPDIYARKFDTTMTPVTIDTRINGDGTQRAQRHPAIAADRKGNVAIIYSDSLRGSFDIVGQMIDVTGLVRESNFQANSYGDSAQLNPSVALDGRYRYIAWADKRNGNFDIYASIEKYNDPSLDPDPEALAFTMEQRGQLPPPLNLAIDHVGYNPLDYRIAVSDGWMGVSPANGTTPDTVMVSITTDTLPFGTYLGSLTLIDTEFGDSSVVVPVRLDVTVPQMALPFDTLYLNGFGGVDDTVVQMPVANSGSGSFTWTADEAADWIELDRTSGVSDESVAIHASAAALSAGTYIEPVEFDSPEAYGAPDTVWLVYTIVDDEPYLQVEPDSVFIATADPEAMAVEFLITNPGVGEVNWQAEASAPWLQLNRASGGAGDMVTLTFDVSGLDFGLHQGTVVFTDSAAYNRSVPIPVGLELLGATTDTVVLGSAILDYQSSAVIPLELIVSDSVIGVQLPILLDSSLISYDSLVLPAELIGGWTATMALRPSYGAAVLSLAADSADADLLGPGRYHLADLYVTAKLSDGVARLDTTTAGSMAPWILGSDLLRRAPGVIPGEIRIGSATPVEEDTPLELPGEFVLHQNYPNPFNGETTIRYSLPVRSRVELEIFNILGQRVSRLVSEDQPAGSYDIRWQTAEAGEMPSGVYFYRLTAGASSLVRKMILIK